MKLQRKKLALLISLIGVVASPHAFARSELSADDASASAIDAALIVPSATALDRTRWTPGFSWRVEGETIEVSVPLESLRTVRVFGVDWAPGEVGDGDIGVSNDARASSAEATVNVDGVAVAGVVPVVAVTPRPPIEVAQAKTAPHIAQVRVHGKWHRVREFAKGLKSTVEFARADDTAAYVRSVRLKALGSNDSVAASTTSRQTSASAVYVDPQSLANVDPEATLASGFNVRFEPIPLSRPDAGSDSIHADRLMDSLAAVLMDTATGQDSAVAREPAVATFAAVDIPLPDIESTLPAARSERIQRPEIVVATQSSKVLRSLEAMMSDERDEVGAIKQGPIETLVPTHVDKVWATLGDLVGADPAPPTRTMQAAADLPKRMEPAPAIARSERLAMASLIPVGEVTYVLDAPHSSSTEISPEASSQAVLDGGHVDIDLSVPYPDTTNRKSASNPFGDDHFAISETTLDRVRGGFVGNGLNISFGIERAVYVNGSLVSTQTMNMGDLGKLTTGRAAGAVDAANIGLVQNGAGNVVSSGPISAGSIGTVIQNTLDGQKIQNVTVINAASNGLGLLKSINFQASLQGAVIDSLRR